VHQPKRPFAAERLAVAAITLPITSLSSILAKNVILNDSRKWVPPIIFLLIMLASSVTMLRWARKQGLVVISRFGGGDMRKMIVQATAVETFR
jgi:hypothetical protein